MNPPSTYLPGWLAFFEGACTFAAAACAVYVALRDGRWRKSGLAKQLSDRIGAAQASADHWHETPAALALKAEVDNLAELVAAHGHTLTNVATKTDVARIEGAAKRLEDAIHGAAQGVDRIEGILIKRALTERAHG